MICLFDLRLIFKLYNGSQHYGGRKWGSGWGKPTIVCRLLAHLTHIQSWGSQHDLDLNSERLYRKNEVVLKLKSTWTCNLKENLTFLFLPVATWTLYIFILTKRVTQVFFEKNYKLKFMFKHTCTCKFWNTARHVSKKSFVIPRYWFLVFPS